MYWGSIGPSKDTYEPYDIGGFFSMCDSWNNKTDTLLAFIYQDIYNHTQLVSVKICNHRKNEPIIETRKTYDT